MTTKRLLPETSVWENKIYGGEWKPASGGVLNVTEKATGAHLATVGQASASDVAAAALAAKRAQQDWAQVPGPARGDVIRRYAHLVEEHAKEISEWLIRETGSVRQKAAWEVHNTARELLEAATLPSQPIGQVTATEVPGRTSIARRIPVGVVGVITPWNSPMILSARALGPALAMGNAIVLKPDPQTPVIGGILPAMLLEAAGLPKGLLQLVPGGAETGQAVVTDPNIKMVSFTGSTAVGRLVGELAGKMIKRTSLELGGNNAFIVREDADLEAACSAGSFGSFFHQGQICLTAGRHFVHEKIFDQYVANLVKRASMLKVGDPYREDVALGPIINERQAARVDRIISESVAMGAKVLVGGKRSGLFYQPTVMVNVTPEMPVFKEEIFGPVAPVIPFKTDEEAVRLGNMTEYGLSAAVQSADLAKAMAIADQLHSGIVHINEQTVLHEVYGPIGGVGCSGNGFNYGSPSNADQFTEWQWLTMRGQAKPYSF